jgi:hypothetical protein
MEAASDGRRVGTVRVPASFGNTDYRRSGDMAAREKWIYSAGERGPVDAPLAGAVS